MESGDTQCYVPDPNAEDVSPNNDGGVMKSIIKPGEGVETPRSGDRVFVHYTGKLMDGTKFDSSVDRGEEFQFTLGKGEVIKAWDIGVATMKKGEKCILVCQADYAYGKQSPPKIPADSTLIFEVELIKWQMEDLTSEKNGGVLRSIIQNGEGYLTPSEGEYVEVHLIGTCAGKIFEERDVKYQIGEACEAGVVEGVDIALKKFKKGEKSKIYLTPKYAFGAEGNTELNVPANSPVEYEITLNNFEKQGKESWEMTTEEKLEQSEIVKNKGTKYFKEGRYEVASKQYQKIIKYLAGELDIEGEEKEKKNSLLLAGYLNLAASYLKLEKYQEVIENCEKAVEIDPRSSKGLFRKGQAYLSQHDYEVAKECFTKVLEIEPSNKAAQKELYQCNICIKKQLQKEKEMYKTIFKKMTEEKDEEPSAGETVASHENGPSENKGS